MDPSSGPQPPCGICLDDTPVTYGLLPGCSHPFCLDCITLWRSKRSDAYFSDGANMDKVIKLCPLCRQPSKYVFPSSLFWEKGQRKDAIEKNYLIIVGKVPCKYLERGIKHGKPFCPYGDDCHYSHMINGIKHKFDKGASELLSYMRGSHDGYRIEGARRRFHGRGRRGSLQPDNFPSDDDMPLEFPIIGNPLLFRNDVVLLMSSMLLDQNPETVGQAGEEDEGDDEDDEGEENDEEEEEEAEQGLEDEIYLGEGDDFEVDSLDDLGEWGYDDWDDEYDDDEEGDYPGFGPLMQF
ncbi:E3 ubiquitin-protein ligase makorin, partial [Tremellales sp. Uapishka_1]